MPSEKALALVLQTTDWSETSRIATLWTREFGKVRALAKGGRRLKSSFESALDLLTVCSIVFLRKSSGSLDLLTEAQVVRRYPRLRTDLACAVRRLLRRGVLDRLDRGLRSASAAVRRGARRPERAWARNRRPVRRCRSVCG